jgi:O-antigen/teichoic acid export membrane protein
MKPFTKKIITSGSVLIIAMMVANVGNLFFSGFLGRIISLEEFSEIALINTFAYYFSIGYGALTAAIIERVAFLNARNGKGAGASFFRRTFWRTVALAVISTVAFMICTPFLNSFFHITDRTVFLSVAPMIFVGTITGLCVGYLKGLFLFSWVALLIVVEVFLKIALAILFVSLNMQSVIHTVIVISMASASLLALLILWLNFPKSTDGNNYRFPRRFFLAAMLTNFASNAFLTLDMSLVKHYLSGTEAGQYALLALVGKMIFFLGSLLNAFVISFVSRDEGLKNNPNATFYRLIGLVTGTVLMATIVLGVGGQYFVPLLLGTRTLSIVPYLLHYSITIALFTIATTFVIYHLARKQYIFSVASLVMSGTMALFIVLWHASIWEIVNSMLIVSVLNLVLMIMLHSLQKNGGFFIRNVVDMISLVLPLSKTEPSNSSGKRVLVFNWRDVRHVFAGGAEVYIHELAKRWVKSGNKVTVFCGNDGRSPRYEVIDGVEIIRRGGV